MKRDIWSLKMGAQDQFIRSFVSSLSPGQHEADLLSILWEAGVVHSAVHLSDTQAVESITADDD
jgi:hypothetical protein